MTSEAKYQMKDSQERDVIMTDQQKKCIDYKGDSVLVIKGTAGSGKSLMLVKIAMNIRDEIISTKSNKNILFIAYNKTLIEGTKDLLEIQGIPKDDSIITVSTIDRILGNLCKYYELIPGGHYRPNDYSHSRKGQDSYLGPDKNNVDDDSRIIIIGDILKECKEKCKPHAFYDYDPEFWAEEILWMYRNGIVDGDDKQKYFSINREGRCKKYNTRMKPSSREIAFDIFTRYNKRLMEKGKFEWDRLYAILDQYEKFKESAHYDYVLIDEAQDFSFIKMRLAKKLCKNDNEFYVAMDKNQSLYGHRWSFKKDLGMEVHVKKLNVIHRNSYEIDMLARDLKKASDTLLDAEDNYDEEPSKTKTNILPYVVKCSCRDSQLEFILHFASDLVERGRSVAILTQDYSGLNTIRDRLSSKKIPFEYFRSSDSFSPFKPGIKLLTIHSSKGLGFNSVFIPFFEKDVFPKSIENIVNSLRLQNDKGVEEEIDIEDAIAEETSSSRRLAYVAATRAIGDLFITYSGKPSVFISELDKTHYQLVDENLKEVQDESIEINCRIHPPMSRINPDSASDAVEEDSDINSQDIIADVPEDPLLKIISQFDLEVIDRRFRNSTVWIIDSPDVTELISVLRKNGYIFTFTKNGSRATDHRPGWYLSKEVH